MGALALAVLLSVGTANGVGAERVPSGGDSHQQGCRAIQDRSRQLLDEYKLLGYASNGKDPRLDTILAELRNLGQMWKDLGCDVRYGSIIYLEVLPGQEWHVDPIVADPVMDVSDPLLTESPAWHAPMGELVEMVESPPLSESTAYATESEAAFAVAEPGAAEDATIGDVAAEETDSQALPALEPLAAPVTEPDAEPIVDEAVAAAPADETIAVDAAAPAAEAVEEPVAGQE
jgi:hypothetical protein